MTWIRYLAYFAAVTLATWGLTSMELAAPGSLKLQIFVSESSQFGTSEYSPVEIIQAIILATCAVIMGWVARHCPAQAPIAAPFCGLAVAFLVRELDYFFDRLVADNFWQVLIAVLAAVTIAYTYRQRRRLQIALGRIWPSPGLTILFAGAVVLFSFASLVGHEPLWQSILQDDYRRIIKLAVEEFVELLGYYLWMIGTIEYALQARAIAMAEPLPAAQRRRSRRRKGAAGPY